MRLISRRSVDVDEENPYWVSFSDIMAALVVIFIMASLLLLMQLVKVQQKVDSELQQLQEAERVRRVIVLETVQKLREREIDVEVAENHTVIRVPNHRLGFAKGEYEIGRPYQSNAKAIGEVLSDVIRRDGRSSYLDTVFIEGHTDNRPFDGPPGKGNWGLSTFRAISLWEFWGASLSGEQALTALRNRDGRPLFSVSGYGPTRPVIEEQFSEDEYKVNRRVDIRFTIRRPSEQEYDGIKKALGRQQ